MQIGVREVQRGETEGHVRLVRQVTRCTRTHERGIAPSSSRDDLARGTPWQIAALGSAHRAYRSPAFRKSAIVCSLVNDKKRDLLMEIWLGCSEKASAVADMITKMSESVLLPVLTRNGRELYDSW